MSCSHYKKLMYLFREGELSDWEMRKFLKHLQNCDNCSQEFEDIQTEWKTIRSLKSNVSHPEPVLVTRDIIRKIEHENKFNRAPKRNFDILNYIPIPQLRFVLSAIVFFLVGGLLLQEVFIWNRMNNLERRMAITSTPVLNTSRSSFTRILDSMVDEKSTHITMSRTEFEKMLRAYSDVVLTNKILLDALRDAVPELDEHFYENGIDKNEMEKLLNNRQKIMSRLRDL